jgi:chromosome segregation protein
MDGFDAKRKVIEGKKKEIVDELAAKQKYQSLIGLIERLKGAIRSNEDMIKEKQEQQRKLDTEELKTGKETEKCKAEIAAVEAEMVKMRAELRTLEAEASKYAATAETNEMERLTANIEEQTKKERETSDALVKGESEITAKNELMAGKKHEIEAINASLGIKQDSAQDKAKTEIDGLKAEIGSISKEIDDIFQRERELHQESANLDKRLLELREKSSVMRVQTSPAMANPALKTIQELKNQGEMDGIFGTVADLIKFETKFTAAVEAAAGNRLLYVVVRDSDVATKIIRHLKKIGGGRATFIPLREIRVSESPPKSNYPSVASILKHSIEVKKAIDYVFGETLLMTDIEDAKRFGIGNARMVTLDGEVFERSGIISGGKVATSILAASQLAKMEQEIADVKTSKETVLRELSSLREEGNSKRSEKAAIEIRLRTIEIELRSDDERLKSNEKSVNRKKQLEIEVAEIVTFIKEKGAELEKLKAEQKNLAKKISELRVTFAQVEAKSKEVADETAKKRNELTANISANRATLEAKNEELKLRKEELFEKEERLKEIGKEKKELMENLKNLQKQVTTDSGELATNEEKLSSLGKQAEKLNAAMKEYEAELQKIGEELGKLKIEIDRHTKERYSLESKRETARQRLADFKGEFERYKEFEMLDAKKDELEQMVKNAEEFMNSNPNVNMGAIEAHEKKKTEVEELQKNIETLNGEKNAVLQMINEIDARKKESFYETFDAVSDRFRHLFEKVHIGQGFLHLDNPNEPFQSGLHIKLRRNNHDHSIESLSGGENTIMALLFVFSLQFVKPSPFYILDEVDAALDKENSKTVSDFVKNMAGDAQFILVSHNDQVIANATAVLGVSRVDGVSKIVGIKLEQTVKTAV